MIGLLGLKSGGAVLSHDSALLVLLLGCDGMVAIRFTILIDPHGRRATNRHWHDDKVDYGDHRK